MSDEQAHGFVGCIKKQIEDKEDGPSISEVQSIIDTLERILALHGQAYIMYERDRLVITGDKEDNLLNS